jgi:hypothetical protein
LPEQQRSVLHLGSLGCGPDRHAVR